ncbi:hypothetical protein [Hydrogenimonas sp.]
MHFNGLKEQQELGGWIEKSQAKGYVERELYRLKRYGSPVTIGMFRCEDPRFEEKFYRHSRRTDHLVPLAKGHFLFLYDHTELPGAFKAAENLMIHLDRDPAGSKSRVALMQLQAEDELEDAIKRLLTLFVIASRSEQCIVDDSVLAR